MKIATTLFLFVVVGFSVGDELGFRDSLSNTEALSKRRSVQDGRGNFIAINPSNVAVNRDGQRVVPPFKPLPPGGTRPMAPQPERQRLVVQQNSTALKTIPAPALGGIRNEEIIRQQEKMKEEDKARQQQRVQQEVLAMQMLKQQRLQQQEAMRKQQMQKMAQQQQIQKIAQQQMQQQQMQQQQVKQQQMKEQQQKQQLLLQQQQQQQQPQQLQQEKQMQQQQQQMQQQSQMQQQQMQQQQLLQQQQLKQQQLQQQQQQIAAMQTKRMQVVQGSTSNVARLPTIVAAIPPAGSVVNDPLPKPVAGIVIPNSALPPFIAMPKSSAQLTNRISHSPTILEDSVNEVSKDDDKQLPIPGDDSPTSSSHKLTLLSFPQVVVEPFVDQSLPEQLNGKRQSVPSSVKNSLSSSNKDSLQSSIRNSLPSLEPIQSMETSLKALAEASNITLEALEAAIFLKQQQLLQKQEGPTTTTTTTTTTLSPVKNNNNNNYSGTTKVMNAPREYYPVGYDKNFDDNFASRVDLPDTSFYCGDQKHFPGLYADEDLGCMVFHVCALTDDGLIMKSFLCPESTLFDQTILKCNWWFYVDCKSSKTLYDSNIPISKSYQLMKALAFFSAYKNHDNSTMQETETEEARSV
ncbi:transcription factor SPT20 homolog isoform X2 [Leptopilina heterotoma]|uniref:transcription factor SPT20 homolog isoform X2 n=1 Tax=Leptopilina heterotoma TaxID=63436 RepID=UPI001CA9F3DC|nr:transcription factor SPT20 homolog isoform X2 [Leptopilina heterotoma]